MAARAPRAEAAEEGVESEGDFTDVEDHRPLLAPNWRQDLYDRVARSRRAARTWSVLAAFGLLSFSVLYAVRASGDGPSRRVAGNTVSLAEKYTHIAQEGHSGLPGSKLALVVGNVSSDGNSKKLSATEGDILFAQEGDVRGWAYVQRSDRSGYLPSAALATRSVDVVAGYSPHGEEAWKQLELHPGDRVWIILHRGNWTYVAKPSDDKAARGVARGYVPAWALSGLQP